MYCTEARIKQMWKIVIETWNVRFFPKLKQFSFLETSMFHDVVVDFYRDNVIQKCHAEIHEG